MNESSAQCGHIITWNFTHKICCLCEQ